MARPSAASSRIEPSEMPANRSPARSPHAIPACTSRRLFCAAARMSSSASCAAAESSVRLFGLFDSPNRLIAARRACLSPLFISIDAAVSSSSALISASLSFSTAFLTSGSMDASAPPASALAAARRSARSFDRSRSAASASATAPRTRLLATTSTGLPSITTSPSANFASTAAASGSPSATSAPIAWIFSSLSPLASFSTAALSMARAGDARKQSRRKAMRIEKGPPNPRSGGPLFSQRNNLFLLLLGHQRRLILFLVVAGDERAPGLRLDRTLGLPDHVELAVGLDFTDEHRLVQMVVLRVHHRGDARGRLERLAAHCDADLRDVERLRLLDRLLPHVDADVGSFHRIVGQRL